jgi:hypothetical protein
MPKRKVIEDSDTEDNAEITPPRQRAVAVPESNVPIAIDSEDCSGRTDVQQSADPSTGSTGLSLDRPSSRFSKTDKLQSFSIAISALLITV